MPISSDYQDLLIEAEKVISYNKLRLTPSELVSDAWYKFHQESFEYDKGLFVKKMFVYGIDLKYEALNTRVYTNNASLNVCSDCGESKPANLFCRFFNKISVAYQTKYICSECSLKLSSEWRRRKVKKTFDKGLFKKCNTCEIEYEICKENFFTSHFNKCRHCVEKERIKKNSLKPKKKKLISYSENTTLKEKKRIRFKITQEKLTDGYVKHTLRSRGGIYTTQYLNEHPELIIEQRQILLAKRAGLYQSEKVCAICESKPPRKNDTYCRECRNLVTREYSKNYSNERVTEYSRKQRETLGDYYIKEVLRQAGHKTKDITPEMIELKREQLRLKRQMA